MNTKKYSRRDFLNIGTKITACMCLAYLGMLSNGCSDEISTKRAYTKDWFGYAKKELTLIENLNTIIDEDQNPKKLAEASEKLENLYLDPILQEWKNLQEENLVRDSIRLGNYNIKVVKYEGPVLLNGYITSDVRVKIELYKDNRKIDLNKWPFTESKWLNLRTNNWSIKKILED